PFRPRIDLLSEFLLRYLVSPVSERPLCEFHDVALVDKRHRAALVLEGVFDSSAYQSRRTLERHHLHPHADPHRLVAVDGTPRHLRPLPDRLAASEADLPGALRKLLRHVVEYLA